MNKRKITSKEYRIIYNAVIGAEKEIFMYSIFCKDVYSIEQCMKRQYNRKTWAKVRKTFNFLRRN